MDKFKSVLNTALQVLRKVKPWRIIALVVVVAILYQLVTTVMLCNVVLDWKRLSQSPQADKIIISDLSSQQYKDWLSDKASDDYIETDGIKLHSLSIMGGGTSHSYVLVCHPATCSADDMAEYAYHFYDLGFNVLVPDARGCGESGGEFTFGQKDVDDIALWVNRVINLDPEAKIFLFGVGMGGSTVAMASDDDLPNVKGIIEDSGYNDLNEVFKANVKELYNKNKFPALAIADLYVKYTKGWSFKDVKVDDSVKNAKVPVLFIHGGDDKVVPVEQCNSMANKCRSKGSDDLHITGAAHCRTMHTDSEKYWRTVDEFILENLD